MKFINSVTILGLASSAAAMALPASSNNNAGAVMQRGTVAFTNGQVVKAHVLHERQALDTHDALEKMLNTFRELIPFAALSDHPEIVGILKALVKTVQGLVEKQDMPAAPPTGGVTDGGDKPAGGSGGSGGSGGAGPTAAAPTTAPAAATPTS